MTKIWFRTSKFKSKRSTGIKYLVKDVPHVCLGLSKPHCKQFGTLDWDEVCLAFVGYRLCQEGLTTTWWTIEQHSLRRGHSKFEELVWMFHRVLHQFLQFSFDILQTTDILPGNGWNFHCSFTQSTRVALAKSPLQQSRINRSTGDNRIPCH